MRYLIIFIFICLPLNNFAQLYIGIKGGLTISDFSNVSTTYKNTGYKIGASVQYMFSTWGIQSGIYTTEKGVASSRGYLHEEKFYPVSLEISPRYLELPISAVYKIPVDRNVNIEINLGGYLAYGIGGRGLLVMEGLQTMYGINVFDNVEIDNQDLGYMSFKGANHFDYGLSSGISMNVYGITIHANYDLGLGKVFNTFPIQRDNHRSTKNRTFWIGTGYNFKLPK
ncbi:MAG: PorT family protein [Tannerella sp.]|jgi:hypothetical protein|nr:PorT family protein [Tannerella sp.]